MKKTYDKFSLANKKAVVTGGCGLIGKEIVRGLAEAGAKVFIVDINREKGNKLASSLVKDGYSAEFIYWDTIIRKIESNIKAIFKLSGHVDIWVNNAYPRTKDWADKIEKVTPAAWQKNIDMQLNSYALCSKYAAENMAKKGGSIINMGSIYGVLGADFTVYEGTNMTLPFAYSAIKGGIVNLSRYLASYFGKHNVRVNTICPGGVFDNQNTEFVKKYSHKVPLKRMAKVDEIASVVIFLASDAASYITGATLMVDGGWSIV